MRGRGEDHRQGTDEKPARTAAAAEGAREDGGHGADE
jgi:hypothetical protein